MRSGSLIYLDTQVLVWLHAGAPKRLSRRATEAVAANDVLVSPAVVLELEYLFEIGRIGARANEVIEAQRDELGLRVCEVPFDRVVQSSLKQSWTRDPFDRLIVGHAVAARRPLVTADQSILDHYPDAIW